MQHPTDKLTVETDDVSDLVAMTVTQATDGSQLLHLTLRLDGRKVYEVRDDGLREQPERLFLTNGVNPRYLRPAGFGQD